MAAAIDYPKLIRQLEDWTREGAHSIVHSELKKLHPLQLPREFAQSCADLAYRNNELVLAMRFLNPIVRPKTPLAKPATANEKMIYATALLHLGAIEESSGIFNVLNANENPEILLHQAFVLFGRWNYKASIPLLNKYLQVKSLTDYRRLVGKVNLAAAQVFSGNAEEAEITLPEILVMAESQGHQLLFGNALELSAQNQIHLRNYTKAKQYLEKAEGVLSSAPGRYLFYVKKGKVILDVLESQGSPKSIETLNQLRNEAKTLHQWETLRDCDLFEAIATRNIGLVHKVIIGTPHTHYKDRVSQLIGQVMKIPKVFDYQLRKTADKTPSTLDLAEGKGIGEEKLNSQQVMHNLLLALTYDFYKPPRMGFLFSKLFPNEQFNPFSSPHRILSNVHRLNKWFLVNLVPARIEAHKGEFEIKPLGDLTIRITPFKRKKQKAQSSLEALHQSVGVKAFDAAKAAECLKASKPKVLRLIQEGLRKKRIIKLGQGRSTIYRFSRARKAA